MAQIKCEYCGNFIEDSELKCKYCGAPNENLTRTADGTPKTISELKDWYIARNLPDESVTRFFIGKNISEPRAFGIYEDAGKFIVYKNKADGTRAVRYEGTDQEYAVKELYLRLKEEILDQKARNNASSGSGKTLQSTVKSNQGCFVKILVILAVIITLFTSCTAGIVSFILKIPDDKSYYYSDTGDLYFYQGLETNDDGRQTYDFWKYDFSQDEWSLYSKSDSCENCFPDGVKLRNKITLSDLGNKLGIDGTQLSIFKSRSYIDSGHHLPPDSSYYSYGGILYYYNYDPYGAYYGNGDNSGWYEYSSDDGWTYYCDTDDHDSLGDDLWYDESAYSVGSTLSGDDWYAYTGNLNWDTQSFETTSWYQETVSARDAYEKDVAAQESQNNDSDYDWDSSSSWDSGSTDWSSDW